MSIEAKEDLFVVGDVKLYGLYRQPLYNKEHQYYFQNLFIRGEVEENIPFIKICDGNLSEYQVRDKNDNFIINILKIVDSNSLPDYDKAEEDDNENFLFHGAKAKILIFCGEIVAIGNSNEIYWISTENLFKGIEKNTFNKFKKKILENKMIECQKKIERHLNSGNTEYEKYLKDIKFLNNLRKIKNTLN